MAHKTGDETADFLLGQLALLRRVGSHQQKQDAAKWEAIIRTHAEPAAQPSAVNFATSAKTTSASEPDSAN